MILTHFFRFNDGATALPPPRPASRSPRDAAILLRFGARYDEGRRESTTPSPPSVPLLVFVVVVLVGGDVVVKRRSEIVAKEWLRRWRRRRVLFDTGIRGGDDDNPRSRQDDPPRWGRGPRPPLAAGQTQQPRSAHVRIDRRGGAHPAHRSLVERESQGGRDERGGAGVLHGIGCQGRGTLRSGRLAGEAAGASVAVRRRGWSRESCPGRLLPVEASLCYYCRSSSSRSLLGFWTFFSFSFYAIA